MVFPDAVGGWCCPDSGLCGAMDVGAYVAPQDSKETGGRHTIAEIIVPLHLSSSDTCDSAYQSTRDALIISAHIFSDVAFLVMMVATVTITLTAQDPCK